MVEKTTLVLPGKRLSVPKLFKRFVQIMLAVALTSGVALAFIAGSALLIGKKGQITARLRRMAVVHQSNRHPCDDDSDRCGHGAVHLLAARE